MLSLEDTRQIKELRNQRLRLESFEFACESSVRRLRRRKLLLEFLSFALAIGVLFILWIIGRDHLIHDVVAKIATGVALLVLVVTVWGHMAKWTQHAETKAALSRDMRDVVEEFQNAERTLEPALVESCQKGRVRIDNRRKDETAQVDRIDLQLAHQHVASKYPNLEIECGKCRRKWNKESALQRRIWLRLPWTVCPACGIRRENES